MVKGKTIENFAHVIQGRAKLIAPAEQGMHSVELGNAMLFSALSGKTVQMPLDAVAYERKLKQLIRQSKE